MLVPVVCPSCALSFEVPETAVGTSVVCGRCGAGIEVRLPESAEPLDAVIDIPGPPVPPLPKSLRPGLRGDPTVNARFLRSLRVDFGISAGMRFLASAIVVVYSGLLPLARKARYDQPYLVGLAAWVKVMNLDRFDLDPALRNAARPAPDAQR